MRLLKQEVRVTDLVDRKEGEEKESSHDQKGDQREQTHVLGS